MRALIMAGGEGTRLREVTGTHPKSMVPVLGRPILEHQLRSLRDSGISDITLITGRLGDEIKEYFGSGGSLGLNIDYFEEPYPMGTGGALFDLRESLSEDFLLIMGDLMLSVDFDRFARAHRAGGGLITLFVHPSSHPFDSDIIVTDEVGRAEDFGPERCGIDVAIEAGAPRAVPVTGFISKKAPRPARYHNITNAGLYIISPAALDLVPAPGRGKIDIDRDIVLPLIDLGRVCAYRSTEYVRDLGTPIRYEEVCRQAADGVIEEKNLSFPQRCVFIDRDGTINEVNGFVKSPEEIRLLPGAAEAIRLLNASEYLSVLITNQPVIARGEAGFRRFDEIEQAIETQLGREGAYLDAVYYCPHHPDSGFEGEVKELKFRCRCRKPEPGLILQAALDLRVDLGRSFMIGDSTLDILAGQRAGVVSIGVGTGNGVGDGRYEVSADFMADDLLSAVRRLLSEELLMVRDLGAEEPSPRAADIDIHITTQEDEEDGERFVRGLVTTRGSEMGFRMYERTACLYGVLTYDSFLRQGYASAMIDYVCGYLAGLGIEEVILHVSSDNTAAFELYKSLGFRVRERVSAYRKI